MVQPPRASEIVTFGQLGPVVMVLSRRLGSLGDYGRILSQHLPVAHLELDAHGASTETFDASPFGLTALLARLRDMRMVTDLRSVHGVLHFTHQHLARYGPRTGRPFLVTVHDLARYTDLTTARGLVSIPNRRDAAGLRQDYAALHRAAHLIAVSSSTRQALIEQLNIPKDKVSVVYEGVDTVRFRPQGRRPLACPYVLFVGSEQPRKNLPALLRAFTRIKAASGLRDLRLVKVGWARSGSALSGQDLRERTRRIVRELGLEDSVVFAGRVPDGELAAYYTHAECLVLPSLLEGFGLPPLEAMACGCPVVVSSAGALPEVVGDAAMVVDPYAVDDLAHGLHAVLTDPVLRETLRERGLRRVRSFTWERAARQTLEVYNFALTQRVATTPIKNRSVIRRGVSLD